ncbi:translation initiation factor IF-2 subunit alpha [Candidatus Woesearchaeota archaeon]|nr:translation initiation factor IF-2 subunit alpha [Candidatus Woesearchaeota archaeon]
MFYKKQGLPEEDSLIVCTVKKILPNSVFVDLDEYGNVEGMIHISEISPGRIRNLRDFVKENKKLVCKVLRVDNIKNHVDLSLRRVNLAQKKEKDMEYKQELKAEKLLENFSREMKTDMDEIYVIIAKKLLQKYGTLYNAFLDIANNNKDLKELGIEEEYRKTLVSTIREKIKPPEVSISGTLTLSSTKPNGISIIKNALNNVYGIANVKKYNVSIKYISAPNYKIDVTAKDYKSAEKIIGELTNEAMSSMKKEGGFFEFKRQ